MMGWRLTPEDESPHAVEAESHFNESMYANAFDRATRLGAWFRVGNRPNEGFAEVSSCVYLPDGRVGFFFSRPGISGNDALAAGGLRFEIEKPFERVGVVYRGKLLLLEDPWAMVDPKRAFATHPLVDASAELAYRGLAHPFGGEPLDERGEPVRERAADAFARGHYEQHLAAEGEIRVGTERFALSGTGLRDHSWGPRHWQSLRWYRWLPFQLGSDFAMTITLITRQDGTRLPGGMVLHDGVYTPIEDVALHTEWDANRCQKHLSARVRTRARSYEVEGSVLSLIPLRNRRKAPDGSLLETRIAEGMTEYRCEGRTGYGMAEYLDQLVGGAPVGADEE